MLGHTCIHASKGVPRAGKRAQADNMCSLWKSKTDAYTATLLIVLLDHDSSASVGHRGTVHTLPSFTVQTAEHVVHGCL